MFGFIQLPPEITRKDTMTHTELVKALKKDGRLILSDMTAQDADLLHMAIGVSGEAGELLDAAKKVAIYNKPADFNNIVEELGDLEFYLEGIRQNLGITREECLEANITKLQKRYSEGRYTNEQAVVRADKGGAE
jgi:NTP pyrophosphatase (non-canonical NTP hydrolase)